MLFPLLVPRLGQLQTATAGALCMSLGYVFQLRAVRMLTPLILFPSLPQRADFTAGDLE